jgi:hypothetical protein
VAVDQAERHGEGRPSRSLPASTTSCGAAVARCRREPYLVQDLVLSARVVRYRRERWLTPAGETIMAPLPGGVRGHFGPELRRFVLMQHHQGQVTVERLVTLLAGIGVSDDAGQFDIGQHALCWVHAERLVHKLEAFTDPNRTAQQLVRSLIWWFYPDLKADRAEPTPRCLPRPGQDMRQAAPWLLGVSRQQAGCSRMPTRPDARGIVTSRCQAA